jgi:hypothetical protein
MSPVRLLVLAVSAVLAISCTSEHRPARERYNDGVAALARGEHEAAEKALLEARDQAGVDPELRYRAAYDLGVAYAAHALAAKGAQSPDLAKALELDQQAVAWFGDAVRLRKDDPDATANLAIVQARAQALADELRRGEGKLEARLDALLKGQRDVLEGARKAWAMIKERGGADPLAGKEALIKLADTERGLVAEAGVIGDLASDEIDQIGKKAEDKRTQQEQIRVVQLKNLDLYLIEGRSRIAEARRKLQELAAEAGVERAEAALVALKRAREQLLDPITVLKELGREQGDALRDTHEAASGAAATTTLAPAVTAEKAPAVAVWLSPTALAERQGGLRDRLEEVRARLAAAVEAAHKAPAPGAGSGAGSAAPAAAPAAPDPKEAKMIAHLTAALPSLTTASAAMDRARGALTDRRWADAQAAERDALIAIALAIEEFSDLKQTIELAWTEHAQVVALLGPEAAKQLAAAERAEQTRDGLRRNFGRLARIKDLLADEVAGLAAKAAELDAQAAKASAGAGSAAPDPKQLEAAKAQAQAQLDQARAQLTRAEELRGKAEAALHAVDAALTAAKDPLPAAQEARGHLDELRRLFFSVIEHLQELLRQENETRDQTSTAAAEDDFTRGPKLPGLLARQDEHATMAQAITDALAHQADAASKAPAGQGGPSSGGPDPKALGAAADEVRLGKGEMGEAKAVLQKAKDATTQSVGLTPAVEHQAKAAEHLENALKLLQPPPQKQDPKDQKDQKQDPKDQKQDPKDQKQDPKDPKQAQKPEPQKQGGASQKARDDDARRQRERMEKAQRNSDPIDKDW